MPLEVQSSLPELRQAQITIQELATVPMSFSERLRVVMATLRGVVPAETVNLGTIDLAAGTGSYQPMDGFLMPPNRRALLPFFIDEHPMLNVARERRVHPPLRFSDFQTRREFEETALYRECYRGYTHSMLTFNVPAPSGVVVSFAMSRDSADFSDRERDRIALLQPVIVLFMENALLGSALDVGGTGARTGVILGSGHRIQHLNEEAVRILRAFFPGHPRHLLPEELGPWVAKPCAWSQVNLGRRTLRLRMKGGFSAWTLGLVEEVPGNARSKLTSQGLTGREIEILEWIEKGKANGEIGIILGISPRTVEKHLERTFNKLGVSSRHAAARVYRDSLCP